MPDFLQRTSRTFLFLAMLVLVVAILSLGRYILIPLSLGVLFSFLLGPLVRWVQRAGLKRVPAVILVSAVAFVLLGLVLLAIGVQMVELAQEVPGYAQTLRKKIEPLQKTAEEIIQPEAGVGPETDKEGREAKAKSDNAILQGNLWAILWALLGTAQEVVRVIASAGLVVVLTIVTLIYKEEIRDRFIRLTGSSRLTVTTKALDEAAKRISDYLFWKALVNAICGGVVTLGMLALGVPAAFVWGFLLAVLRFIPSLGFWLALIPPAVLGLIAVEGWETFVAVVALYLVTELVALNVIEPRFYGRQIGLLPVATLVSLTFWTWLWGPVGLLLAIPITLCLAVLGKYVPTLDFLATLLSDAPAMDPKLRYYQRLIANDQDEATEIVESYLEGEAAELVFDDVLVPALSHAKRDVANNQLTVLDQKFFFQATGEILDNVCAGALPREATDTRQFDELKILGCPVGDENDGLALVMVNQLLQTRGYQMQLGAAGTLSAEIVEWVATENPAVACVLSVAPGELTQTRFVCKRLRARTPALRLIVARLQSEDLESEKQALISAGADLVCESVVETSKELIQAVQKLALEKPNPEEAAAEPAVASV